MISSTFLRMLEMGKGSKKRLLMKNKTRSMPPKNSDVLLAANDGKDRNNNNKSVLKDFFILFQDTC